MTNEIQVLSETIAAPDPTDARYEQIDEVSVGVRNGYFNGCKNPELFSAHVSGVKLVWANDDRTRKSRLAGRNNLQDITIAAHTIEITTDLHFPQTAVSIYAKRLHLKNGAKIITTPLDYADEPDVGEHGMPGTAAGSVSLFVDEIDIDEPRKFAFVTSGGRGQQGGPKGFRASSSGDQWHRRDMPVVPLTREGIRDGAKLWDTLKIGALRSTEPAMGGAWRMPDIAQHIPTSEDLLSRVVWLKVNCGGKVLYEIGQRKKPWNGDEQTPPGRRGPGGAGGNIVSRVVLNEELRNQDPGLGGKMSSEGRAVGPGYPNPGYFVEMDLMPAGSTQKKQWVKVERFDLAGIKKCGQSGVAAGGGNDGTFSLVSKDETSYLTFASLELIVAYARDALRGGAAKHALAVLDISLTDKQLHNSEKSWANDTQLDAPTVAKYARALIAEASAMRGRAMRQLDYFGNPVGWVPLLSVGTNAGLYRDEVERALKTMGLASTIMGHWDNLRQKSEVLNSSLNELRIAQEKEKTAQNAASAKFQVLRESIASIDRERAPIGKKITELRQKLYKKAEDKTLERQAWEKFDGVLKMLAGVACLVPVGQPFVRLATDTASKLTKAVADVDRDPKKPIDIRPVMTNADELFKALKEAVNENGDADDSSKSLLSRVDTTGVVDQFLDGLKPFLVNADEIDAEINDAFAKLEDADPDITDIKNRVSALQSARKDLVGELILQSSAIQTARTAIRKKQQMIDTARAQKENVSARLNPALKVLARQMQQEAMDGINQYLYYLAKAYEFHALKAAPLAESMNNMAEELTRLFADPGADTAWSESDFNGKIGKILDDRFGKILDTIRNEMVRGYQERAARGKDVLTMTCKGKPVFDALYAELCKTGNAEATFRPEDIGYAYARGQGNTRIANVVLKGIQFDRENDTPLPTTMSVELSHSGVSILRAGKTAPQYAFVATGAVKWGANCSFKAVKGGDCEIVINPFGPSEGDKELWKALKLPEQLSLYCPAFHAPLTLKIQTLPKGSQVRIKELELDFSLEV